MMEVVKKTLKTVLIFAGSLYILVCGFLYFAQENMIFFPKKLPSGYVFTFNHEYEEITIAASDGIKLNGLLFQSPSSKGLVFYLHGNAGALDTWGMAADAYLEIGFDCFILDYRSYGKSEGKITSEQQFYDDVQTAYNKMLERYDEGRIIIAGYSLGTGPATKIATDNSPGMLILQAPFYNLTEIALSQYPFIPAALLKYKFKSSEYITTVKCPILIFHGASDSLIPSSHSQKLKEKAKPGDKLFILPELGHNGMNDDTNYRTILKSELNGFAVK